MFNVSNLTLDFKSSKYNKLCLVFSKSQRCIQFLSLVSSFKELIVNRQEVRLITYVFYALLVLYQAASIKPIV